jgi:hypothetical protein
VSDHFTVEGGAQAREQETLQFWAGLSLGRHTGPCTLSPRDSLGPIRGTPHLSQSQGLCQRQMKGLLVLTLGSMGHPHCESPVSTLEPQGNCVHTNGPKVDETHIPCLEGVHSTSPAQHPGPSTPSLQGKAVGTMSGYCLGCCPAQTQPCRLQIDPPAPAAVIHTSAPVTVWAGTAPIALLPRPSPTRLCSPSLEQRYLGLKSTLQGPKGARVCKQGGQPWAGGREGREELQERESILDCGLPAPQPGGSTDPVPPTGPEPRAHSRWNVGSRGCPAWARTCQTGREERGGEASSTCPTPFMGPAPTHWAAARMTVVPSKAGGLWPAVPTLLESIGLWP